MRSQERKQLHMGLFLQNKNKWVYLNALFFRTTSETKFHFNLSTVESNVNRIYFMAGWNFITSLRWTHFRMFTWDFISSEIIFFNSVFQNCFNEIPRNETHRGCYLIAVILTKTRFHFGWYTFCKHYPEIKSSKRKHLPMRIFHENRNIKSKYQTKMNFISFRSQ